MAFARWPSRIAAVAALVFALALAADPGPLALLLYLVAVTLAALLPRTAGFDNGWRWMRSSVRTALAPRTSRSPTTAGTTRSR